MPKSSMFCPFRSTCTYRSYKRLLTLYSPFSFSVNKDKATSYMYLVPGRYLKAEARTSVTYKVDTHLHGCMPVHVPTSYLISVCSSFAMTIVCLPKGFSLP